MRGLRKEKGRGFEDLGLGHKMGLGWSSRLGSLRIRSI